MPVLPLASFWQTLLVSAMSSDTSALMMRPAAPERDELLEPRRVLLDTNVLLDYLDARRGEHETARRLVHAILAREGAPVAPASSYKDVYYILRRSLGSEQDARRLVRGLIECVPIATVSLRATDLAPAIAGDEPDFEDAIVRQLAERERVVAIVTRDAAAFRGSFVPVFSPAELLALLDA